jgi:hypothetical protein
VEYYLNSNRYDLAAQQVRRWQAALEAMQVSPTAQAVTIWQHVENLQPAQNSIFSPSKN